MQCIGVLLILRPLHLASLQVEINPPVFLVCKGYAIFEPVQISAALNDLGDGFKIVWFLFHSGFCSLYRRTVRTVDWACLCLVLFAVARSYRGGTKQQHCQ